MSIYTIEDFTAPSTGITKKVSKADKLEYGEIYTPFSLIEKMLDLFDPIVFTDPQKTWLDIGAGQGYFSLLLFNRLNKGLENSITNEAERKSHIVQKMLHMIELKDSNVAALRALFGPDANIIHTDFCTYQPPAPYDYIIGNPPYNAHGMKKVPTNTIRDKKRDGITLWTVFIRQALLMLTLAPATLAAGQLCLIVPALWMKPDKSGIHQLLTQYKIEKIHCLSSNETNTLFKGEAQTPTCYFLLTNTKADNMTLQLYDIKRQAYVTFPQRPGHPLPLFAAHVIQKLERWIAIAGSLPVKKTNMPPQKSQFTEAPYNPAFPYINITSCVLAAGGLQPLLLLNYSDGPQAFHGQPKLVLAHKMYGFPYFDREGHYGIANRDNYVLLGKTVTEFEQLQAFLSSKFALYIFAATRYRMKYLERYAFDFLPDITKLPGFPPAAAMNEESIATFFGLDEQDKNHIMSLHRNYKRFI